MGTERLRHTGPIHHYVDALLVDDVSPPLSPKVKEEHHQEDLVDSPRKAWSGSFEEHTKIVQKKLAEINAMDILDVEKVGEYMDAELDLWEKSLEHRCEEAA